MTVTGGQVCKPDAFKKKLSLQNEGSCGHAPALPRLIRSEGGVSVYGLPAPESALALLGMQSPTKGVSVSFEDRLLFLPLLLLF